MNIITCNNTHTNTNIDTMYNLRLPCVVQCYCAKWTVWFTV